MMIRQFISRLLTQLWWENRQGVFLNMLFILLLPFSLLYYLIIFLRRKFYFHSYFSKYLIKKFSVPIIVVGNITVGGTGKTPLVIWLVEFLQNAGYRPGIISRGYGAKNKLFPAAVSKDSNPVCFGDEAVLIARLTDCPVVIDPKRTRAAEYLLKNTDCNIIISDDGLQHYALSRQIEIAVVDGARQFGNGYFLPAGPLRESVSRIDTVDFVVINQNKNNSHKEESNNKEDNIYHMSLLTGDIYNILQPDLKAQPDDFAGETLHAVAGIGNPDRFFRTLRELGLSIWPHSFADHHIFQLKDFDFNAGNMGAKIIMTEKDAVKCLKWADYRYWCLPVKASLEDAFGEALLKKLPKS